MSAYVTVDVCCTAIYEFFQHSFVLPFTAYIPNVRSVMTYVAIYYGFHHMHPSHIVDEGLLLILISSSGIDIRGLGSLRFGQPIGNALVCELTPK